MIGGDRRRPAMVEIPRSGEQRVMLGRSLGWHQRGWPGVFRPNRGVHVAMAGEGRNLHGSWLQQCFDGGALVHCFVAVSDIGER